MFPSRTLALSLAAAVLSSGCHSKTDASPDNFIKTLNAYYLEHADCLLPDPPRFPFETGNPEKTMQMDSLVKAQLLTVQKESGGLHASRYTPTEIGARAVPRFCYGHRAVTAIDSFTPPAQANGFPETKVAFHYEMKDVPIWAKTADVQAAFPEMARATSGSATATATLAKTMAGWQVPD